MVVFLSKYMNVLHTYLTPTSYDGFYAWLISIVGPLGALPFGIVLALLGMSGIWLIAFFVGIVVLGRRGLLGVIDVFPAIMILWSCYLMLLAPTPFHGDYTDFRQRGFVLVFIVLLIWSARFSLLLFPFLARPIPVGLSACLALAFTLQWMPEAKIARMTWARQHDVVQPRPGLIAAARWIAAEARPGESFLINDQRPAETVFDDATVLLGTSGVPAWLSRPGIMRLAGPPRSNIAAERLAQSLAIHEEVDPLVAKRQLLAAGIGFYLSLATAMPAWDPEGRDVQFHEGEVFGWRITE
jgi:hypothetical protein